MFPADIEKQDVVEGTAWVAKEASITDKPEYSYRGMHLDVARHFFTVEQVKRQIDLISQFKINKLHMHLSDDQGWRLEIKGEMYGESLDKLRTIGASTSCSTNGYKPGQYTQEAFVNALAHAKEISASDTALDESINEALGALQSAMDALNLKDDAYDLSLLIWLIAQTEEMNGDDYLEAGWNELQTVLEQAAAIQADPASQEEIDQACMDLNAAILNLRLKPSEELLRELSSFVETVKTLNLEVYSADQRAALFSTAGRVQAALDGGDLDQDQAKQLAEEVRKAKEIIDHPANLNPSDPATQSSLDQKQTQQAGKKSVRTAASTSFGSAVAGLMAAALAGLSIRRRRR